MEMIPNFIDILCNPFTQQGFIQKPNNPNAIFDQKTDEVFRFQNNTAYLFKQAFSVVEKNSPLHNQFGSNFLYHEHYIKDSEVFDYFAEPESAGTRHENRRLHETVFRKIDKSSHTILDVGCGGAWVAKMALPKGFRIVSMDISSKNPELALQKYPHPNHFGLGADVYQLPLKNETVDTIIASEIMEHVPDPVKFVEILFSKLIPHGKLIITTPYNEKIKYHLCVHCNKPTPQSAHLHVFNENNIQRLIPAGSNWKFEKFNNRYLTKLRTHLLLQFLPYYLWRSIDRFVNLIFPKQERLIIEITKI